MCKIYRVTTHLPCDLQYQLWELYFRAIDGICLWLAPFEAKLVCCCKKVLWYWAQILSTDSHFMLGPWIESAKKLGSDDNTRNLLEFNARNQVRDVINYLKIQGLDHWQLKNMLNYHNNKIKVCLCSKKVFLFQWTNELFFTHFVC